MLVLSRRAGERVLIGDDIVITILDTRGDGVRIGFDAPKGVKIHREEVVRAVTESNLAAAEATEDGGELIKAELRLQPAVPPHQ